MHPIMHSLGKEGGKNLKACIFLAVLFSCKGLTDTFQCYNATRNWLESKRLASKVHMHPFLFFLLINIIINIIISSSISIIFLVP